MAALARASSDVIVEILSWLDIESVLQVGDASTSLRTTTSLDRVWAPRLATCGLTRFAVDARALAELSTIQVDARRLCLQCLPWRPRRGIGPDTVSMWQSSWSWRPSQMMPERLHQPSSSGDWIFVEVYEAQNGGVDSRQAENVCLPGMPPSIACIKRMVAQKFISVKDCDVDNFPNSIRVPLNLEPRADYSGFQDGLFFEVRVLMQLDGIMVPLLETCCMDGQGDERHHISSQCGFEGRCLSTDLTMDITYPDTDNACCFHCLGIQWHAIEGNGEQFMRDFHKAYATLLISKTVDIYHEFKYSFACDYKRDTLRPNFFDFRFKKPAG